MCCVFLMFPLAKTNPCSACMYGSMDVQEFGQTIATNFHYVVRKAELNLIPRMNSQKEKKKKCSKEYKTARNTELKSHNACKKFQATTFRQDFNQKN